MTTHNLKIMKEFADAVYNGLKTFEIRRDDRGYKPGQHITFRVIEDLKEIDHPLNNTRWVITYILSSPYLAEGHVALAIRRVL